ncbi:unnamed protein product [Mesocestoides corti]|uniref:Beta-galactosidase n=1 Tax=Mesocestoides corti TaxID=53468 RepID=A0A0R3U9G4_MESCO|nr:unnamed protein product [Mesocestoides corti]
MESEREHGPLTATENGEHLRLQDRHGALGRVLSLTGISDINWWISQDWEGGGDATVTVEGLSTEGPAGRRQLTPPRLRLIPRTVADTTRLTGGACAQ